MIGNNNNNAIILRATEYTSNRGVLGVEAFTGVSTASSMSPPTHSHDFRNLLSHSMSLLSRNTQLPSFSELFVIRSRSLLNNSPGDWNDQYIMNKMNKISLFKQDNIEYRRKIANFLENGNPMNYFNELQYCSEKIVRNVLKTVFYTEGTTGIIVLQEKLNAIIRNGSYDPDCLRLYNILMYSAPFVLCNAFTDNSMTPDIFFHSPFELIATKLQTYVTTYPYQDLNYMLKLQLRVELALPEVGNLRNIYDISQHYYTYGRRLGTISLITSIPTLFTYYTLPRLMSQSGVVPSSMDTVSTLSTVPTRDLSPSEVDGLIRLIADVILEL